MNFGAMIQTWMNVLTHPGEAAFQEEQHHPQAKLSTAIIWVAISGVVAAIFNGIGALIGGGAMSGTMQSILSNPDIPPEMRDMIGQYAGAAGGGGFFAAFCGALILTPIVFLIVSGILFVIAKMFGGDGEFEEQTYLLSTFGAPLTMVNAVIGIVPILGACLGLLIGLYQLVLATMAIKVSHNLDTAKAVMVVLVPVVVIFLCFICIFAVALISLGAVFGSGGNF